jgi:3-phenylpropionate/trans-cinnamate dioxygenase ferredoxin subunit
VSDREQVVCAVTDVAPGERRLVTVRGRSLGVFNLHGEFHVLHDRCPHRGAPLCRGVITGTTLPADGARFRYGREGEILRCPWHGWEFDVRTGQSWCDSQRVTVRSYKVEVAPGASVVEGPYVAETFAVAVEDEYVVVEV